MNALDLAGARLTLQRRRAELLEAHRRALSAIDQLRGAERDPERAEGSASEQLQYDLARLAEVEDRELARLDAALARLDAGAYGTCRSCGEEIDRGRLAALPFGLDCADCASGREEGEAREREREREARPPRPMAPR